MKYNPEKHRRRSIRLKGYNYSSLGYYFVTMCVKSKELLFEPVFVKEMIEQWWLRIPEKFLDVLIDEYVIMPNHFHGIIVIMSDDVGVSQCGYPKSKNVGVTPYGYPQRGRPHGVAPTSGPRWVAPTNGPNGVAPTLGDIVGWFKTMTTNEYIRCVNESGWKQFPGKLWQRNYYEHVIRNANELRKIREYIVQNPLKWELDMENPESVNYDLDTKKYFEKILQE